VICAGAFGENDTIVIRINFIIVIKYLFILTRINCNELAMFRVIPGQKLTKAGAKVGGGEMYLKPPTENATFADLAIDARLSWRGNLI